MTITPLHNGLKRQAQDQEQRPGLQQASRSLLQNGDANLLDRLQLNCFLYTTDSAGNLLTVTSSVSRVLGLTAAEFHDRFPDLARAHGAEQAKARRLEAATVNGSKSFELHVPIQENSAHWLRVTGFPVVDDTGEITAIEYVAQDITDGKRAEENLHTSVVKLRSALSGTIKAMARTVESRDAYTAGHQRRVTDFARSVAQELGLSALQIDGIRMAGVIHDLGKITVPSEILNMPRSLNPVEFSLIKVHPLAGFEILRDIEFQWPIADIVLQHHERLNGTGYPNGLTGPQILPEAKVLAVADVAEAICSHRPYRPSLGVEAAIEELSNKRGEYYDAEAATAAIDLLTKKNFRFKDDNQSR